LVLEHKGADLKKMAEEELIRSFGKPGRFYYKIVRGIDNRQVQPHRESKSVGAEDTFSEDLTTIEAMNEELDKIAETVVTRLQKYNLKGRTVTLKIKYHNFRQITRNYSFDKAINDFKTIINTAKELLLKTEPENYKIRLLGITLSNFGEVQEKKVEKKKNDWQLELF
jgi:DNA polymerase IV